MRDHQSTEELREEILSLVSLYASRTLKPRAFDAGVHYIPPSGKLIDGAELRAMTDAVLDGWLTTGRFNDQFEQSLAKYIGVRHARSVNSGSSANLVAFSTLTSQKLGSRALKSGDEVITVAAGFPTTVNPILQNGATPVFVDIELGVYNIDASKIEEAISPRTRAIMLAHTLGNPFDLETVTSICKKYDLWLIEDCCDALGSKYNGKNVGTFGDIGTLSFYPAHHITTGEGGAVFTNHAGLMKIAESIRDWGRDCYCAPGADDTCSNRFGWTLGSLPKGYDHKYTYSHMGYNLKITDVQAACGVEQLAKADAFVQTRKDNFTFLRKLLEGQEDMLILPRATQKAEPAWFGFPITLRDNVPIERSELLKKLEERRIGTRLLFAGNLIHQPYMRGRNFRISGNLANSDIVMNRTFWIGLQPSLSLEMLEYSAKTLINILKGN